MWGRRKENRSVGMGTGTQILNIWIIIIITRTPLASSLLMLKSGSILLPPRFCLYPPVPPGQTLTTLRMWLMVHLRQGACPHYSPVPVTPVTSPVLTTGSWPATVGIWIRCPNRASRPNHFMPLCCLAGLQANLLACGPLGLLRETEQVLDWASEHNSCEKM